MYVFEIVFAIIALFLCLIMLILCIIFACVAYYSGEKSKNYGYGR